MRSSESCVVGFRREDAVLVVNEPARVEDVEGDHRDSDGEAVKCVYREGE